MSDTSIERSAIALFERMLDVPEQERDAWIAEHTVGQPEVAARLRALRAADQTADRHDTLKTGGAAQAFDEDAMPVQIGAYRIVARIGRGGMGSVYRGERAVGDFAHQVAIKVIKPGLLSDRLVERFQRERQTLASLSHVNIAQLYDGGETPWGSPYIVMELVDGSPLLRWTDENNPSLDERRRLFGEICAAVSFAHQSLIVHRDLTPSNVLINKNGTVKLIDFGIAKPADEPLDGQNSPPSVVSLSLTPGYAAPERLVSAEVTTAADIFSLGKLLEKLILPRADDREPIAIVQRATAARPQDRYVTVDALVRDVAAWAGGRPVAAVNGGRGYVLRKFLARNRLSVAASAAALLLLIGALVVTLAANQRALKARAEAENRFEQTRAIAKTLLFSGFREVSKLPGSTKARELLASTGLTYIDALASDPNASLDVRLEAGRGYTQLARVVGGGQAGQLGKNEAGNSLLDKAEVILRAAYALYPNNGDVRRDLSDLLIEKSGNNLYNNNEIALGREQSAEAEKLLEPIARQDAHHANLYLTAIQAQGDSLGWDDEYAKAEAVYLRAETFAAGLPAAIRDDPRVMAARSANLRLLAEAHHQLKKEDLAEAALDRAVAINRSLVALDTNDPRNVRKLAISLWYRAVVQRANKKASLAAASIDESLANVRLLQLRDPNDAGVVKLFGTVGEVKGQILADQGKFAESFAIGAEVVSTYRRLIELAGNAPGELRSLATVLATQGGNFYAGRDYVKACKAWRDALDIFTQLDKRGQLSATDRNNGVPELRMYLQRNCERGPPRAGMGKRIENL